jgi:hypothetical protein
MKIGDVDPITKVGTADQTAPSRDTSMDGIPVLERENVAQKSFEGKVR